jgi:hypothetical protein
MHASDQVTRCFAENGNESKFSSTKGEPEMYRQGDVLIVPIAAMPPTLEPVKREKGRIVLAHGEVTGHSHAITSKCAALFRDPKLMAVFMHVSGDAPVALEHDEHATISIPPGDYQIIRQVEYSPEAVRNVAD